MPMWQWQEVQKMLHADGDLVMRKKPEPLHWFPTLIIVCLILYAGYAIGTFQLDGYAVARVHK